MGMLNICSSSSAITMASLPIPTDQETLLYFATFLADAKGLQHGTIIGYLYGVLALHINMGLLDPLKVQSGCTNASRQYIFSPMQSLISWPSHMTCWY